MTPQKPCGMWQAALGLTGVGVTVAGTLWTGRIIYAVIYASRHNPYR